MAARSFGSDLAHHLGQRQSRRAWAPAAQDRIISPAGLLLGFSGAGASKRTPLIAGSSAIVAEMPTPGEAKWAETAAERDGQIAATAEERQEPKAGREAERAEIVAVYVAKEPAPELAGEVVDG
ncbi:MULTISPECIES: VIT1/CCC1 transporter family protein [Alphaproteobacteria]|uniref:VIT1/CCC1 transporter family protein n=1 Tax=Alphaproteobacteria TaxID=28211 RepID=UPI002E2CFE24|nr:VIT1/CCC1 transporter family protein [Thermaurantiacus tibetensis]